MSTQARLDERHEAPALDQIERALAEVRRLCQPTTRWRMTIPVDVDDSDVVITGALIAAKKELLVGAALPAEHAPPDHGGQLPEIQAFEDAAVHVAYVAEDFLRGGADRGALAEAVKEWITAQRVKDAAIDRVLARAMNL